MVTVFSPALPPWHLAPTSGHEDIIDSFLLNVVDTIATGSSTTSAAARRIYCSNMNIVQGQLC